MSVTGAIGPPPPLSPLVASACAAKFGATSLTVAVTEKSLAGLLVPVALTVKPIDCAALVKAKTNGLTVRVNVAVLPLNTGALAVTPLGRPEMVAAAKVASNSTVLVKVLPRVNVPRAAALVMAKSVATGVGVGVGVGVGTGEGAGAGAGVEVKHAAPLTVTV